MAVEEKLLLSLARVDLTESRRMRAARLIENEIRWDELVNLAIRHRVFPLVYRHLQVMDSASIPHRVLWQLGAQVLVNEKRNRRLKREWLRLLEGFADRDIPVIPVKGIMLGRTVYGHASLRVFSDLDFLIRECDLDRCKTLLEAQGYRADCPLDGFYERRTRSVRPAMSFRKASDDERSVSVDLQYELLPKSHCADFLTDVMWQGLRTVVIDGVQTWRLSDENRLMFLCLHAWKHAWCRLQWICDIAEVINGDQVSTEEVYERSGRGDYSCGLDWGKIVRRAAAARISRTVLPSLLVAERLLDAEVPEWVLIELNQQSGRNFSRVRVKEKSPRRSRVEGMSLPFAGVLPPEAPSDPIKVYCFHFRYREGLRDRVKLLFFILFWPTETDIQMVPLPQWLFPLYYVLRPLLLVVKLFRRRGKSEGGMGEK